MVKAKFKKRGRLNVRGIQKIVEEVEKELSQIIVGQKDVVREIISAVLCDGHVLVEGVPGVAKTLIVKAIAIVMGCGMQRIQFTVDLLPTDITGITTYTPQKGFGVMKGPVFTNFVLADEINRSPPKTQSSLLEAMQEKKVTISRKTYDLPKPFFVMATENPLEVSGVYTLPEAQIDRFLFKLLIDYPKIDEEKTILTQNITINRFEDYKLRRVLSPGVILSLQKRVKEVFTSEAIKDYIVKIVDESRCKDKNSDCAKYIAYGASPRASIALYIASKAEALISGRDYVIPQDVQKVAFPVLRHRIILNFEAEADKVKPDGVIKQILNKVVAP
ncbi:ATPase [Candidatus Pacearchaeota archaeon]|nr:ATPase [Candidatus Pacearchaeota archaeon]|tara:strand:+ start:718 stop:1713 length:996 start_codon:yes stop_codon:yes gene_type:complete